MLSPETLRAGLRTSSFGKKVFSFETIDSTNSCARALADCWAEEGTVVFAEYQTAGRGRLGRTWVAAPGENLTFSLVLRPRIAPDAMNLLSLVIAVGVARGITRHTGANVLCKWPNDLLCGGRKLAGILLEGVLGTNGVESVIAGIGINVNQTSFPDDIAPKATSLALATGSVLDKTGLFRALLESLEEEYLQQASAGFRNVVRRWLDFAPIVGKRIALETQGRVIEGIVRGISGGGGLIVSSPDGENTFLAGDVTIVDQEPYAPYD